MTQVNTKQKRYSISAQVPEGQGDYGSEWLCVMNATPLPSRQIAINVAERLAGERNTRVLVFVGKDIGKLIHDTKHD